MAGPDDLPDGWEIAGWESPGGDWRNTEESDPMPTGDDLSDSYQIVVSFEREDGSFDYYSIMGGVDDWEGLADAIADLEAEYG